MTDIYYLYEYNWERGELLSTGKKNYKIRCSPPSWSSRAHERYIPKDKCAFPADIVCVVWETWRGKNGRGGHRVERILYPLNRIPADQVSRQSHGPGRVTE